MAEYVAIGLMTFCVAKWTQKWLNLATKLLSWQHCRKTLNHLGNAGDSHNFFVAEKVKTSSNFHWEVINAFVTLRKINDVLAINPLLCTLALEDKLVRFCNKILKTS